MENLYLNVHPELVYYPIVDFNAQTGVLEISGESYMEETYKFYEPVFEWLNKFANENHAIIFNIKLTYLNTSSSRFILEFLEVLKTAKESGKEVVVNWFYKKSDPDMIFEIKDFIEETGLDINPLEID